MEETDFPWRKYTNEELDLEYERIKKKLKIKRITFPIKFSCIGYKCTNVFFQYERMNTIGRCNTVNPIDTSIDCWEKNRKKIQEYAKKMNKDMFSALNYYARSPCQFQIILAGKIYKHFKATKVFDPYAGWGDRCLAAMALGIDYIGVDCNTNLKDAYNNLIQRYNTTSNISITIDKSENINISQLDFDFVLSSPPFWDEKEKIVEKYNNTNTDYKQFLNTSLIPVMRECLKKNVSVCLYLPKNMYDDISKIFGECNYQLTFNTKGRNSGIIYCWIKN